MMGYEQNIVCDQREERKACQPSVVPTGWVTVSVTQNVVGNPLSGRVFCGINCAANWIKEQLPVQARG